MSTECCYQLHYGNGEPVDTGDGIPHFPSLEKAIEEAVRYKVDRLGTPAPVKLAVPCVSITCSKCEYVLDEEDEIWHFQPEEIEPALRDWEWKVDGDRRLCPECTGGSA